jgi:hypothetical protein
MRLSWERKRNLEDTIIGCLTGAIAALILFILAMLFVDAWVKEDIERVERLKRHQYEIMMEQSQRSDKFTPLPTK